MNKIAIIIGSIFLGLILMVTVIASVSYIGATNYGVATEATLKASRDNNKNILAQYQQKILEAAQVPDMYKNDYKEILQAEMTGRYGDGGSKASFQFLKEHDVALDSKMYLKLQQMTEAGRNDFARGQEKMIDIRRSYETQLGYFWRGTWLRVAGFPKIDFKEYQPVTTDRTEDTFKAGKESAPIKLR